MSNSPWTVTLDSSASNQTAFAYSCTIPVRWVRAVRDVGFMTVTFLLVMFLDGKVTELSVGVALERKARLRLSCEV
jgi:hypothetical protein